MLEVLSFIVVKVTWSFEDRIVSFLHGYKIPEVRRFWIFKSPEVRRFLLRNVLIWNFLCLTLSFKLLYMWNEVCYTCSNLMKRSSIIWITTFHVDARKFMAGKLRITSFHYECKISGPPEISNLQKPGGPKILTCKISGPLDIFRYTQELSSFS